MSKLAVTIDGRTFEVELIADAPQEGRYTALIDGDAVAVLVPQAGAPALAIEWLVVDGRPYEITFDENMQWLRDYSGLHQVGVQDLEAILPRPRSGDGRVKAPIPGLIRQVLVQEGEAVKADQPMVILEAMKMENEIRAPFDGVVRAVPIGADQTVVRGEVLVEIS